MKIVLCALESCPHKEYSCMIFRHIQCLHLMYSEVAWVLVSWGAQVQLQITLDPDYFLVGFHHLFFWQGLLSMK